MKKFGFATIAATGLAAAIVGLGRPRPSRPGSQRSDGLGLGDRRPTRR